MPTLFEATRILSTPLGSLVYHLLLLLAVEAMLGMSFEEWRRARRGQASRLLAAAGGLLLARLGYVLAALAASLGWLDRVTFLPPLERLADTVSLAILAWLLLAAPGGRRRMRPLSVLVSANLAAGLVVGCIFVFLWSRELAIRPAADYGVYWQAVVWSVWQLALAAICGMAVVRGRVEGWGLFVLASVVMVAGRVMQIAYPWAAAQLPAWERLSNLVAYPLLVIGIYQSIVLGLRQRSLQLQDISQASMDQIKSLLFLFEAGQEMSGSLDLPTVLDNAVQGIARALDADQCAIAFPQDNDPGQMRLAAIYNPARQGRGEGVAFPLDYQLAVRQAMRRKRYVIVEEADNVQLKVLFALLGSSETGPLLIQPLLADNESVGAIIVGNGRSRRPFTPNEAKLCQSMAEQVVIAIQNARRFQAMQARTEELNRTLAEERRGAQQSKSQVQELADRLAAAQAAADDLRRREEGAREARNALEIRLVSSRAESGSLAERLASLESDLAQTHANAEAQVSWHRTELSRQEAAWQEAIQSQERLQTILNGVTAGILIAGTDGRIQEINVAAEILLDREAEELKAQPLRALSDEPRWLQAVLTAAEGEAVRLTLPVANNTLLCDVAPIASLNGLEDQADGVVVIMQDISAESEAQQSRLKQIAAQAEELKGSLATVANYANLILADAAGIAGTEAARFATRLRASVDGTSSALDDLLKLTSGGDRAARRQSLDMNLVLHAAVAASQACLKDKSLSVDLEVPDRLPSVEANSDDVHRVVSHLLLNAYLASPVGARIQVNARHPGTPPPASDPFERNGDDYVVVSVRDHGHGVAREELGDVFDRARPVRTPEGLGVSGADLALIKDLVEAQRGQVWIETENGVGTTFSFALPVERQIS